MWNTVVEGAVKSWIETNGLHHGGRRFQTVCTRPQRRKNVKIGGNAKHTPPLPAELFQMYHKLAGMTGTAETKPVNYGASINWMGDHSTNVQVIRKMSRTKYSRPKSEKYKAVIRDRTAPCCRQDLGAVGTTSVEVSELLSRMFKQKNIPHNVLNAKQHSQEARWLLKRVWRMR